ncbi:MAG: hypothetical protein AAB956_00020, partial [Patescibacteria group bacterium]
DQNPDVFYEVPIINIDHHPHNEEFGQINKIKITAISTTEILFDLLNNYAAEIIDGQLATYLLAGIFAESKSFKIGSLTPNSLLVASQLVALGADRETIVHYLYQNRDLGTLKLWGRVLAKLNSDWQGKLVWSSLNKIDFEKTSGNIGDLSDVIEELVVNVPEAEVIVLLVENNDQGQKTEVKLYTTRNINAASLLKEYGAAGSKNKASAIIPKPVSEAETEIISNIKNKLAKLPV